MTGNNPYNFDIFDFDTFNGILVYFHKENLILVSRKTEGRLVITKYPNDI